MSLKNFRSGTYNTIDRDRQGNGLYLIWHGDPEESYYEEIHTDPTGKVTADLAAGTSEPIELVFYNGYVIRKSKGNGARYHILHLGKDNQKQVSEITSRIMPNRELTKKFLLELEDFYESIFPQGMDLVDAVVLLKLGG